MDERDQIQADAAEQGYNAACEQFEGRIKELEQSLVEAKKEFTEREVIWLRRNKSIGKERREALKQLIEAKKEIDNYQNDIICRNSEKNELSLKLEAMREFLTKIQKCTYVGPSTFREIDELLQKEGK